MGALTRGLFAILAVLIGVGGLAWWQIGPDWRQFLSAGVPNRDVLFWSQEQRDSGFRLIDQLPFITSSRPIAAGSAVKPLNQGAPLSLDMDLDAYLQDQRHAALIVLHDGQIRLESYGLDFDASERWTSFSVAKSLTSTLVGAALKDGHIESLEDKVTAYIPALAGSAYDDVSIAQLLTMTSGVAWNEDYNDPASDVAQFLGHEPEDDLPQIVSYMRRLSRAHPPGTVWNYSTGETNLIGILVGQATGRPLADYLSEKVWVPYGMQQEATWLLAPSGQEISGCCIQAATRDFARFGQFMLDGAMVGGESILPEGWIARATTKQAEINRPGLGYGFQWWTYDDGSYTARGIFGQGIFIDPVRRLVIATNSSWASARGQVDGQADGREAFYRAVQDAIDRENDRRPR